MLGHWSDGAMSWQQRVWEPPHGIWELIDDSTCKWRELRKKKGCGEWGEAHWFRAELDCLRLGRVVHFLNHFFNLDYNFFNRNAASVDCSCWHMHRHKIKMLRVLPFFFFTLTTISGPTGSVTKCGLFLLPCKKVKLNILRGSLIELCLFFPFQCISLFRCLTSFRQALLA